MFKIVCKVMSKEAGKKRKRITLSMKIRQLKIIKLMDLICNDVMIDKMAVLVGGLCHALIHSNENELFRTFLWLSQHGTMKV